MTPETWRLVRESRQLTPVARRHRRRFSCSLREPGRFRARSTVAYTSRAATPGRAAPNATHLSQNSSILRGTRAVPLSSPPLLMAKSPVQMPVGTGSTRRQPYALPGKKALTPAMAARQRLDHITRLCSVRLLEPRADTSTFSCEHRFPNNTSAASASSGFANKNPCR